jgi:hypothetical protein
MIAEEEKSFLIIYFGSECANHFFHLAPVISGLHFWVPNYLPEKSYRILQKVYRKINLLILKKHIEKISN